MKPSIILSILVLLLLLVGASFFSYYSMTKKNPSLEATLHNKNFSGLYQLYISSAPSIENGHYYGQENAPVSIIAVLDPTSHDSAYFMTALFPQIEKEFIQTGRAKVMFKSYLLLEDVTAESKRYLLSQALSCAASFPEAASWNITFAIMNGTEHLGEILKDQSLDPQELTDCMERKGNASAYQQAIETEVKGDAIRQRFYIGYEGRQNRIIDGVPTYQQFRRSLNEYLFAVGG